MHRISELKKGSWSQEEDILLKKCIEKYGIGRWHLVPLRAGLNRCRKSCRLRYLNYLRPNLKRGELTSDEVDLIERLHKLLGNRWSLIAGRLPGRTSNAIKNYWNCKLRKKITSIPPDNHPQVPKKTTLSNKYSITIKPKPLNLSRSSTLKKMEAAKRSILTHNNSDSSIREDNPTRNNANPNEDNGFVYPWLEDILSESWSINNNNYESYKELYSKLDEGLFDDYDDYRLGINQNCISSIGAGYDNPCFERSPTTAESVNLWDWS